MQIQCGSVAAAHNIYIYIYQITLSSNLIEYKIQPPSGSSILFILTFDVDLMHTPSSIVLLFLIVQCSRSYDDSIEIIDLMGCNESPDFRPLVLSNFSHNRPRKNEVIRARMYFIGEDPLMSVTANTEYNFGKTFDHLYIILIFYNFPGHLNGVNNFAIYLNYKDWLKQNSNYCTVAMNVSFHRNYYTKMDVVLTKIGDFTVFAYGKSGFTITCRTNILIDTWTPIKVRVTSHARNRGKFYYDCPMAQYKINFYILMRELLNINQLVHTSKLITVFNFLENLCYIFV